MFMPDPRNPEPDPKQLLNPYNFTLNTPNSQLKALSSTVLGTSSQSDAQNKAGRII